MFYETTKQIQKLKKKKNSMKFTFGLHKILIFSVMCFVIDYLRNIYHGDTKQKNRMKAFLSINNLRKMYWNEKVRMKKKKLSSWKQ